MKISCPVLRGAGAGNGAPPTRDNPVRAGVVFSPEQSGWTSHQSYLDEAAAPSWLDVAHGLTLCGFDASAGGRAEFHHMVCSRIGTAPDPALSGGQLAHVRARVRRMTGLPVEIGSPVLQQGEAQQARCAIHLPRRHEAPVRWNGDVTELLAGVHAQTGVTVEQMRSPSRRAPIMAARRLAVVAGCRLLMRPVQEVAAALSTSPNAATKLLRRADDVLEDARRVASSLIR